ncbi:hypothetical protein PMAYCL1PPCAC_10291 [Pristionchus mayeri]|uniref:Uncharacterized protein n=1 Tax=Pristionchus mayeri TaxID=1317129 RepID=A0AAN4ZFX0_9BILA|nr:hypothetical protein PMAYCL1PPCAC_10291 [Pristionchus mayeri]
MQRCVVLLALLSNVGSASYPYSDELKAELSKHLPGYIKEFYSGLTYEEIKILNKATGKRTLEKLDFIKEMPQYFTKKP